MLRKVIAVTATFAMLLSFAACGKKSETSTTKPATQVLNEYTTEKATTTATTEAVTTKEVTTTTEESTTKATATKAEGTTVAPITTTTAAKKQSTKAETQAPKTQAQQQATQPQTQAQTQTQRREEPARTEATQPRTTTQAPVTTKVTTATTPTTTRATTPSTTTCTTPTTTTSSTTTTTTSATTTTSTTTTTTSITTTEATTTTTEPVTEPPVTTTVYEGPLFESMSNPYPEFDALNFAWPEPVGTVTQRRASHDIQNFNYLEDIDCVVFYFDAYMSYLDYYHDNNHTWSNQAISYTNDYGDEIIIYPDKNYISIYGQDYSVTSAFGLNYDTSRTCIISNGYEYFRFDFDKLYDICNTIAKNVR
jgi:hypothetical protein